LFPYRVSHKLSPINPRMRERRPPRRRVGPYDSDGSHGGLIAEPQETPGLRVTTREIHQP